MNRKTDIDRGQKASPKLDNVYRATFKECLENEKGPPWQMMRIKFFFLNCHFKKVPKIHFLGQKLHFLGLGKQPKTTVYSEVISNLKKKINYSLDVCNQ